MQIILLLTWLLKESKHRVQSRNLNCRQRASLESNEMGLRKRRWSWQKGQCGPSSPVSTRASASVTHTQEGAWEGPTRHEIHQFAKLKRRREIFLHPRLCLLSERHWQRPAGTPRPEVTHNLTHEHGKGRSIPRVIRIVRTKATRCCFTLTRSSGDYKRQMASVGEDAEEWEHLCPAWDAGATQNGPATSGSWTSLRAGEPTPRFINWRSEDRASHRGSQVRLHRGVCTPRACVWSIRTAACCSPTQRKRVRFVRLSDQPWTHSVQCCRISLTCTVYARQIQRDRK